jgi:hypothetical protein
MVFYILVVLTLSFLYLSLSAYSSSCDECLVIPLQIDDKKTNIIIHTDDDVDLALKTACATFGASSDNCVTSAQNMLAELDWVPDYLEVTASLTTPASLSRHHVFTVVHRLRRFVAPRSLLVFGAPLADAYVWNRVNSKIKGGITCFVNLDSYSLPEGNINCPYMYTGLDGAAVLNFSVPSVLEAPFFGIDKFLQYADFPWDAIIVYPTQLCHNIDDTSDLREEKDPLFETKCDKFVGQHSRCTRKLLCTQTYLDFASEIVADDGTLFVIGSMPSLEVGRNELVRLKFGILENKFLYRHIDWPHADDANVHLVWYTSQELGALTAAGNRGSASSFSSQQIALFEECVAHEYRTVMAGAPAPAASGNPSSLSPRAPDDSHIRNSVLSELQRVGAPVYGVVFCCRRRYTNILLPYLQRNLRMHGGLIDHYILFNMGTEPNDDAYPAELARLPGFTLGRCTNKLFGCAYSELMEIKAPANTIFVKLDDDILFVADFSFDYLIWDKLQSPSNTIVHGNGVNHMHAPYFQSLSPLHQQLLHQLNGATPFSGGINETTNPFLAHLFSLGGRYNRQPYHEQENVWRNSYLESFRPSLKTEFYGRAWQHSETANSHHRLFLDVMDGVFDGVIPGRSDTSVPEAVKPEELGLREREATYKFNSIPMNTCRCARPQPGFGYCGFTGFYRTTINFVAFQLSDIADSIDLLQVHDEITMTVLIPERTQVSQLMSGRALYAHAAFTPQRLGNFDEYQILKRYKELAEVYLK